MQINKTLLLIAAALLLIIGTTLVISKNSSKAPAAPASNSQATKVKVGTTGVYLPVAFQIAQERDLFSKYDLEVESVEVQKGAIESLVSGQVSFLVSQPLTSISAKAEGADVVWIALLEKTYPYNFFSKVPKNQIKKVGIVRPGGSDHYVTLIALAALGIDPKKVELVQTGDAQGKVTMFKSGQLDAAGLNFQSVLELEKGIPAEYQNILNLADAPNSEIPTGVMTSSKFLSASPQITENFLKALIEATVWAKNHPQETVELLATRNKMTQETAQRLYKEYIKSVEGIDFTTSAELFGPSVKAVSIEKPKVANFDANSFINNDPIKSINSSGFPQESR